MADIRVGLLGGLRIQREFGYTLAVRSAPAASAPEWTIICAIRPGPAGTSTSLALTQA
jgi:hypothetical protein